MGEPTWYRVTEQESVLKWPGLELHVVVDVDEAHTTAWWETEDGVSLGVAVSGAA